MKVGRVLLFWVVVTAADRAAATCQRWGTNPSARLRRAPPLSGEALWEAVGSAAQKAPSAEGAVSRRLTEDKPARRKTTHLQENCLLCPP